MLQSPGPPKLQSAALLKKVLSAITALSRQSEDCPARVVTEKARPLFSYAATPTGQAGNVCSFSFTSSCCCHTRLHVNRGSMSSSGISTFPYYHNSLPSRPRPGSMAIAISSKAQIAGCM